MANNNIFANLARKATVLSPLMQGKTKMSVAEIIESYPNGITVNEFDIINNHDSEGVSHYPVLAFNEEPERFAFGGIVMKQIVDSWVAAFDGDIAACSAALKANGGVVLKFSHGSTKDGKRNVTNIEVVG